MSKIYESYEPDQLLIFPPSLQEWLPESHLAYFISDTVDQLDLSEFHKRYQDREDGRGNCAYHPAMMLKVLLYAYCVGIFSSRKIAAALSDLVPLRYLAAGNKPSHRSIARFRQDNIRGFEAMFKDVVRIAGKTGLLKLGTLTVDGSRIKANASKHKAMSYKRMKKEKSALEMQIRRITRLARKTDKAEDREFGPDFRGDELPEELQRRKKRLEKIREAMKHLEEEQSEKDKATGRGERRREDGTGRKLKRPNGTPPDHKQTNFTDPESQIMKCASGGFDQCYNAQIAVDEKRLIVGTDVSRCPADNNHLLWMQKKAQMNTGVRSKRLLADSGYRSEANFQELEKRKIEAYVALQKGESVPENARNAGPATSRMARRLKTKQGRTRYKARKALVEPVFGWIKQALGFRSFQLRGLTKVKGEWDLVCLALNLRRMNELMLWR